MKLKMLFCILFVCSLTACKKESSKSNDTYFGGLIVNPTSDYVVLLKRDVVIDTFYLDNKNKFGGKLVDAEKGLYVFKHPPENQILYLEPGDSTLLLLNTLEFDESLTFSGSGAAKSNFLNKMYLLNQKNNELILSYYKLDPSDFAFKTDSIRDVRSNLLEKLHKRHNFSREFYNLARKTINYEFYDLRERYAFLIRKHSPGEGIPKLPADFHDYRDEISFNDEQLENYYVYLNLIDDFLRTKSLEYCEEKGIEDIECSNLSNHENIKRRLILADSLIDNKHIKNTFVDRLAAQGIIYSYTSEDILDILNVLKNIDYSGERMEDFRQMAEIHNSLLPGNNLGKINLLNIDNDIIPLENISTKPMVSYHWSVKAQRHHRWQHRIIEDLREKYPEIDFIGINIDKDQFDIWKNVIATQNYSPEFEYKLEILNINEILLKNYLNRLIFLNPSGEIVRGDTQLTNLDYETKILEFLSEE